MLLSWAMDPKVVGFYLSWELKVDHPCKPLGSSGRLPWDKAPPQAITEYVHVARITTESCYSSVWHL